MDKAIFKVERVGYLTKTLLHFPEKINKTAIIAIASVFPLPQEHLKKAKSIY